MDLGIGTDRLKKSVLIDLAVNSDCEPLREVRREFGKALSKPGKQLPNGPSFDLEAQSHHR